ncbi:MAG: carboxypeptidase regulatory-like domain-containing protein [Acidobacteriota bacterium]
MAQDQIAVEQGKPVPVDLGKPAEISMRRAGSTTTDLRTLPQTKPVKFERPEREEPEITRVELPGGPLAPKAPIVPGRNAPAPPPVLTFDGLDFATWGAGHPPDTNGDVGPTYYIHTVNTSIGIYAKTGGAPVAAFTFNTFMSQGNFGNLCDTNNFGDPVVLYDSFEDRWFISDFAFSLSGGAVVNPPGSFQCLAVSKTSDPVLGGWNFYSINTAGGLGDYPKFGVWPDGIYMAVNMFGYPAGGAFQSARVYAFNKAQMYAGAPSVQVVTFNAPSADFTLLPSNARLQAGTPPLGTPNYFVSSWEFTNALTVYKFHVDWDRLALSTFTGPDTPLAATSWPNAAVPNAPSLGGNALDVLQIRAMMQNQYTNFGGVESLWAAHTVRRGDATGFAAPRWYQVDVSGGTVAANIPQAATHDPDGANVIYRFMPSLAVDRAGNMALGYATSSATTKPAIKYAGRLAADPVNTLPQTEQLLVQGTGTQTGTCGGVACARWGDYSAMTLDPNGCTFWYTNEYYAADGLNNLTRIGSFTFAPTSCTPVGAGGTVSGTVTASAGGAPIGGATVTFGSRTATTDGSGFYSFTPVPAGTYPSMTASAPGYVPATATGIVVTDGNTTTQNFSLATAPASACLTDTTQADFQTGVATSLDLTTSPGDAKLSNAPSLDQSNTAGTTTGTGFGTPAWTGMTFIPAVTGQLVQADVQLFCNGCGATPPDLTLSVRNTTAGLPTGADLASTTIPGSTFASGASVTFTATFGSPAALTSGTQYALILRPVSVPAGSGYFWIRSSPTTYANGQRVLSADSGGTWSADATRDYNFKTYMFTGFAASGNLVSSVKDANPAPGFTPTWTTLSFTASTPASTTVRFQVAASSSAFGPFNFVGPDTTAGTFFSTSGGSLAQFNGNRYLQYKAFLATTDSAVTPAVNDVAVCFASVCIPPATPTITPGGPTTFCAGGSVTLTSSSATGNQWYLNSSLIGGATGQAYVATASGSYTVIATVAACPSAPSVATVVTVNPIPTTPTVTPGGPTTFCSGGSVTLTSSSASGNQWYLTGNPIGGATNQAYVATASGSYTVKVTASGCTSAASSATSVTVNPNPPAPVITAPTPVLPGSTGNTATVPATAGSTYAWSISNGTITSAPSGTAITYTAGAVGTLTLSVVETNSNGCVSNTGSVNVTVAGSDFHALSPCRLLDTRDPAGLHGGPAIAALSPRTFVAAGSCGVPSGVKALSVNVTVTQGTVAGDVSIYAAGTAPSPTPLIDYAAGQTRANNGVLALGSGGDFVVKTGQPTGTVHVIVDVNGYFQ